MLITLLVIIKMFFGNYSTFISSCLFAIDFFPSDVFPVLTMQFG